MVGYRHYGRLGNFLFQTAAAIGYANKHGLEFSAPSQTNDEYWNPLYLQHLVNPNYVQGIEDILINENGHHYQELPFEEEWRDKQIVLNGYFQSEKYFEHCKDLVLKLFNYPHITELLTCSIHVRRGDYLKYPTKHPPVTKEYITKAMELVLEKDNSVAEFAFFSDDLDWCRSEFGSEYMGCLVSYRSNDIETDLVKMSMCEHNIISNSTFSWWGAWLNQNPDKIVVCPHEDNWFGIDNKHLDVKDLYPKDWHRVKY